MATITDYFNKAGNNTTAYPVQAVVSQARTAGDTVLVCQSLAGWAADTPVHFTTYKVGADGAVNVGSQTDWKGIVVNNTITQMTRLRGASDAGNAIGDIVELNPTVGWLDDLITGLLVSHNQNGVLKNVYQSSTIWSGFLNKIYPVGSIYMSASHSTAAQVAQALGGGTWVAWGQGRVPVGMGNNGTTNYTTVEATGGEDSHSLTINEMPKHQHGIGSMRFENGGWTPSGTGQGNWLSSSAYHWAGPGSEYCDISTWGDTSTSGEDNPHENRQAYITCYMWKRTA